MKRLKSESIRNVLTSNFEIKEGLKIAFDEGQNEGRRELKRKLRKKLKKIISVIDSNWFYCEKKSIYGNEIINLIKEIVDMLKELKDDIN